jgi:GNAT superfamily N-acetyltransferase
LILPEDTPADWSSLLEHAAQELGHARLLVHRDSAAASAATVLRTAAFVPERTEYRWHIPVSATTSHRIDPTSHEILSVVDLDLNAVAGLDNAIRADIPGTTQWQGTATQLRATLKDDDEFDPALYLVARHRASGSLDGLIRVWNRNPLPRLGCLGVTRPWRRTRLAAALLAAIGTVLVERGITGIVTETDQLNADSTRLAKHLDGVKIGASLEWLRET